MQIQTILADITTCNVDAIVNAANNALTDGAGVNGAIHRAAGAKLNEYCNKLGYCATGSALITPGCNLHAKYIIHTVGPIWQGGIKGEPDLLAQCYKSCLKVAAEHTDISIIAFPAISCGIFGYPLQQATEIAINTIRTEQQHYPQITKIIFCCFDTTMLQIYQNLLGTIAP